MNTSTITRATFMLTTLLLTLLVAAGCQKRPAAEVQGKRITQEMLDREVRERLGEHAQRGDTVSSEKLRKSILDQMISEVLVVQGAQEEGITATPQEVEMRYQAIKTSMGEEAFTKRMKELGFTDKQYREILHDGILTEKFTEKLVAADSITEDDIRAYYQESPRPFLIEGRLQVRFIQTDTLEVAQGLLARFKKSGKSFDAFADEIKKSGEAVVSGAGWSRPEMFSGEIAKGLEGMEDGSVGGPFKGTQGYYVFHLIEKEDKRPKTFEEARDEIHAMLLDQKRTFEIVHWVEKRKQNAKIKIYE